MSSKLYGIYQAAQLQKIKSIPAVSIHDSLKKGEGSQIEILFGTCKQLTISANVSCRKFCSFLLHPEGTLIIHENVFFNNYCSVNSLGYIEIGANTIFGENVKIYDHNHLYSFDASKKLNVEREQFSIGSIKIGKNCWIGSNVTILNNVEIGDNVIIGANCLIYKSIPGNCMVKHKEELIIQKIE